jgi:NAD(P)-dependent dehydrogenase (short-subunit alcohol dehydrogenase family)
MSPRSILITGCNRGIGLELVKQYLRLDPPPTHLLATYRDPDSSEELLQLAKDNTGLKALKFDVAKRDTFVSFVKEVSDVVGIENGLNLVIHNAGYMAPNRELEKITPEDMIQSFEVNCVGPLFLTRELLPLLKTAIKPDLPKFRIDQAASVLMSTAVASIAENSGGGLYPYRCSKTALNMAMQSLSVDLKDTGILIMSMHPGWVQTRMGGPNALIDTETCCKTMIETLDQLSEKDHGAFLRYNNTSIPW